MKTLLITFALSLSAFFMNAQTDAQIASEGTTITINVPLQSTEGNVVFGLYNQDNFMKNPSEGAVGEIIEGNANVTFTNITPGEYAIILFHDKNTNKRMDFDANGMPSENYGLSNNPMSFGPPQWSDAKFEVTNQPIEMEIRM
ncbi:DUF2141 domain-containing protein [Ulvibacter antarcticus]|uniref:Uncharacterized protein (DUF2141 family) n=1 Tax=Ulvibacter antarcticus TaxID=442714 RepID=A0A3L9ZDK1_9FLAO|nr:DUF2141 domain-containing protein [Ulvibacter antarcticus]RMA64742.1 uncharacterized protein (DUF2141 family) [Ulvibacter antarcticus]